MFIRFLKILTLVSFLGSSLANTLGYEEIVTFITKYPARMGANVKYPHEQGNPAKAISENEKKRNIIQNFLNSYLTHFKSNNGKINCAEEFSKARINKDSYSCLSYENFFWVPNYKIRIVYEYKKDKLFRFMLLENGLPGAFEFHFDRFQNLESIRQNYDGVLLKKITFKNNLVYDFYYNQESYIEIIVGETKKEKFNDEYFDFHHRASRFIEDLFMHMNNHQELFPQMDYHLKIFKSHPTPESEFYYTHFAPENQKKEKTQLLKKLLNVRSVIYRN